MMRPRTPKNQSRIVNVSKFKDEAKQIADYLLTIQDEKGDFYNFQNPDGTFLPLQSGNVNFYVSMLFGFTTKCMKTGK